MFNGLDCNINNLFLLSDAESHAISAENPTGKKGGSCHADAVGICAKLGRGWKCAPSINIQPGETVVTADIEGPGAIKSIWITGHIDPHLILRIYWDGSAVPSVECPLNCFFGYNFTSDSNSFDDNFPTLNSIPVVVAPNRGLNCYWQMPFKNHCRVTVENTSDMVLGHYYIINYVLTDVPEDIGYFHAQYREEKPVTFHKPYTVIDSIKGKGQYVGTALFSSLNSSDPGWVEGEMKFYIDSDDEFPSIAYTGIEDYLGGAFASIVKGKTHTYSTPYCGLHYAEETKLDSIGNKYMGYRWHIVDPIRFNNGLKVTVHDLGWDPGITELRPRCDDFSSVAYWYQTIE